MVDYMCIVESPMTLLFVPQNANMTNMKDWSRMALSMIYVTPRDDTLDYP